MVQDEARRLKLQDILFLSLRPVIPQPFKWRVQKCATCRIALKPKETSKNKEACITIFAGSFGRNLL